MLVSRLLDAFDKYTTLPIDVNDVRDKLVAMGVQDHIRFHFVKMDKDKIRGLLFRYSVHRKPYDVTMLWSDIVIASKMGEEAEAWKRLVAVKELLHITDCDKLSASTPEVVDYIFDQFAVPPELRNGSMEKGEAAAFLNDRVRIYFALAVLMPTLFREKLRPLWRAKQLTSREIAEIAKVPVRYVPFVMEEHFDDMIGTFLHWEQTEQPANDAEPTLFDKVAAAHQR